MIITPDISSEHQRLINEHHDARHAAFRWGACAESLIACRNELRTAAGDRVYIRHDGPQLEMLQEAAKALGPFIIKAIGFQKNAEEAMARIDAQLAAPKIPGPVPDGNLEGQLFLDARDDEKRRRIAATGCCGGTPDCDGVCFGIGKCPALVEADRCTAFVNGHLEWLRTITDENGLAAVAARLCVPSPVIESENPNV